MQNLEGQDPEEEQDPIEGDVEETQDGPDPIPEDPRT